MSDKQPTQEQIVEFWEWCGFKFAFYYLGSEKQGLACHYCNQPDGSPLENGIPIIDLNNLFRYAVPKLWVCEMVMHESIFFTWRIGVPPNEPINSGAFEDPALALFWAIWHVVQEVKHE